MRDFHSTWAIFRPRLLAAGTDDTHRKLWLNSGATPMRALPNCKKREFGMFGHSQWRGSQRMLTAKRFARCVCGRQIRELLFIVLSIFNNQKFVLSRTGARERNLRVMPPLSAAVWTVPLRQLTDKLLFVIDFYDNKCNISRAHSGRRPFLERDHHETTRHCRCSIAARFK